MWWASSEIREGGRLRSMLRQVLRYAAVAPIVVLTTAVAEIFYRITGSDRLSSIFLAGVLLTAFLLGSGPAYLAAGMAFIVYLFWVDPRFAFSFGSPEDFNILSVFLAVSVLTGLLTGRVRDEAARAKARQRVNAAILDATREFSASSDEAYIGQRLAHHLALAARGDAAVADNTREFTVPDEADPGAAEALRGLDQRLDASVRTLRVGEWRLRAMRSGDGELGATAWRPVGHDLSEEELTLVEILVDTGAAALSRARLAAAKSEAEARARTEDLRNALLSSISHDLRTPLAAILASATSLQEFGGAFDSETRADLLATIREEAERLDGVVANLLGMSRLESGALTLQATPFNVPEAVRRTLERRQREGGRTLTSIVAPGTPEALGDAVLFEQALGNVIDNALRYSPPETPVDVMVRAEAEAVVVEVRDEGRGVPEADRERIFEKFYRSAFAAQKPGTGLGLPITRGFLSAMGGQVSVHDREDGEPGLVVRLRLQGSAA